MDKTSHAEAFANFGNLLAWLEKLGVDAIPIVQELLPLTVGNSFLHAALQELLTILEALPTPK